MEGSPTSGVSMRRGSAWAEYELRLGDWRVFCRVSGETVEIILIGKKHGNRLRIGRKEVEL